MERMKQLTAHIEDLERYDEIITKLELSGVDYLDPIEVNHRIATIEHAKPFPKPTSDNSAGKIMLFPFYYLALLVNAIPLALWNRTAKKIKDPVFIASIKFSFGIYLFPIVYLLETWLAYILGGSIIAASVAVFCFFSMLIIELVRR